MDPLSRAAASLKKQAGAVGREIAKLERKHVPGGDDLDPIAHERRLAAVTAAIAQALGGEGAAQALQTIADMLQLRSVNGYGTQQALHSSFLYLMVMRRFVVTDGATLGEGLAAWDAVEEFLRPHLGAVVRMCLEMEEVTMPSGRPRNFSDLID